MIEKAEKEDISNIIYKKMPRMAILETNVTKFMPLDLPSSQN